MDSNRFSRAGSDVVHLPRALRIGDKFFDVMVQPGFYFLRRCGTDTQDPALKTAAAREGRLFVISDSDERDAKPYEGWEHQVSSMAVGIGLDHRAQKRLIIDHRQDAADI